MPFCRLSFEGTDLFQAQCSSWRQDHRGSEKGVAFASEGGSKVIRSPQSFLQTFCFDGPSSSPMVQTEGGQAPGGVQE